MMGLSHYRLFKIETDAVVKSINSTIGQTIEFIYRQEAK